MHPTIQQIDTILKQQKKTRDTFACEILDYLGVSQKFLQGTGEERRCTQAWKKQIYRMFEKNITPRPDRLEAMSKWVSDNQ